MAEFSLKQVEVFVAVAELSSFTQAGERLYLTQSTVSAHISALERTLETRLFMRKARSQIHMTAEGQRIYPAMKRILSDCQEIEKILQDDEKSTPLMLGASTVPAQYLLPELLAGYLKKNPEIQFQIRRGDSVEVHELLESGKIRIGFVGTMLEPRNLLYYPLAEDKLVLITENSERFRRLQQEGKLGRDLLSEPFIAREEGSGTERSILEYLHRVALPADTLHIAARMDDPESIKTMVKQGAGVSILSDLTVRKEIEDGRLLSFEMDRESLRRSIYMVCRRNVRYTGSERQFLEFMKRMGKKADTGAE